MIQSPRARSTLKSPNVINRFFPILTDEEDDEDKELVETKTIGGDESQRFNEHFTKSSDHGDEQPDR